MSKVRFKELDEEKFNELVDKRDLEEEKLYFVYDRGALYKGKDLIADNTENSEAIRRLRSQEHGGLLLILNIILEMLGFPLRLRYDDEKHGGYYLEENF